MTTFIITLLIISQIVSFYLIFKRLKPKVIKPKGIVLKPIPKEVEYEDVDPNNDLIYEVLETIKLEDWNLEKDFDALGSGSWRLTFTSKDGQTLVRSRLSQYTKEMRLTMFHIASPKGFVSLKSEPLGFPKESKITNDIILFLWDYVIKEYEDKNKVNKQVLQKSIESIRDSLKTLKRSKRLNDILND